ncbi:MAG: tetratricopeptide repeat protein [Planctomycetaceae bacterium]|jgi:tetratricopeptide (TPR) repeat protein|nr:tetratricopeptide repeat protein [Planctomycetaceae bacterium]
MKRNILLILLTLFFSGCHNLPERGSIKSLLPFGKKDIADTSLTNIPPFDRARLLQEKKEYNDAVALYKAVLETEKTPEIREQVKVFLAQCLTAMTHYAAALKVLEPLPLEIYCDTDAQKLAVAGEILLRQRRENEAVVYLEIAVGSQDLEALTKPIPDGSAENIVFPDWLPAASANLACAYIQSDKPQNAGVLYEFAAKLYQQRYQYRQAEQCRRMCDDLCLVMKNYVPFQPAPVANGLPAGKY